MAQNQEQKNFNLTPGNKIAIIRRKFGLTQRDMANLLSISRGTVSSYELRPNASPSAETIRFLAERFDIDLAWFYDGSDTPPRSILRADKATVEQPTHDHYASRADVRQASAVLLQGSEVQGKPYAEYHETQLRIAVPTVKDDDLTIRRRCLIVASSNMGARLPLGSFIFFRKQEAAVPDTIVIARRVGTGMFSPFRCRIDINRNLWFEGFDTSIQISIPETSNDWDLWGAAEYAVRPNVGGDDELEASSGNFLKASEFFERLPNKD